MSGREKTWDEMYMEAQKTSEARRQGEGSSEDIREIERLVVGGGLVVPGYQSGQRRRTTLPLRTLCLRSGNRLFTRPPTGTVTGRGLSTTRATGWDVEPLSQSWMMRSGAR